jgi:hypothetical protein
MSGQLRTCRVSVGQTSTAATWPTMKRESNDPGKTREPVIPTKVSERFDAGLSRWGTRAKHGSAILGFFLLVMGALSGLWYAATDKGPRDAAGPRVADTKTGGGLSAPSEPKPKPEITGALPEQDRRPNVTQPVQRDCFAETSHLAVLAALGEQGDPASLFSKRFEGRRPCTPWQLTVHSVDKVGGLWRVKLRSSGWEFGAVVYADVPSGVASLLHPGLVVRVDGIAQGFSQSEFLRWGYVHLSNARVRI